MGVEEDEVEKETKQGLITHSSTQPKPPTVCLCIMIHDKTGNAIITMMHMKQEAKYDNDTHHDHGNKHNNN